MKLDRIATLTPPIAACLLGARFAHADDGEAIYESTGCKACHTIDQKRMGPTYKDVAAKTRAIPTPLQCWQGRYATAVRAHGARCRCRPTPPIASATKNSRSSSPGYSATECPPGFERRDRTARTMPVRSNAGAAPAPTPGTREKPFSPHFIRGLPRFAPLAPPAVKCITATT